jgi:putative spermidine/putrescine transport system permease protein
MSINIAAQERPSLLAAGSFSAMSGRKIAATAGLLAPAVAAVIFCLLVPIVMFLVRGVSNAEIVTALPKTLQTLTHWDGRGLPAAETYDALASDLIVASKDGRLGELARRLNILVPGYRTLVMKTGGQLAEQRPSNARDGIIAIDRRWDEPDIWLFLRQESSRWTDSYFLAALDLKRTTAGNIVRVEEQRRIFIDLFLRTFAISISVTLLCLLIGYPTAHLLASASPRWAAVFLIFVLLPFWTSTLVRSTAWIVLLQNEGLFNRMLRTLGIIHGSLPLFANRFAVLVAMTHVLLPYMIMPLYGAMKAVPSDFVRAAGSLGATPVRAFWRVYLPQTYAGIAAGCLLVFILALGYYVTPAIVGGPSDQMVSYFIALYTNESLNWGLASALGTLLLAITLLFYVIFSRFGQVRTQEQ